MKHQICLVLTMLSMLVLSGCAGGVYSKNIVGLTEYKIDKKQIDGVWINNEGAILITTLDADHGIVKVSLLEESDDWVKAGPLKYQIMAGENWIYFNELPTAMDEGKIDTKNQNTINISAENLTKYYKWGRIKIDGNRIILWAPSTSAFIKAIDNKQIIGTYNSSENGSKAIIVKLTDSPKNIVKLVEQEDKVYFYWDNPDFFIKLTNNSEWITKRGRQSAR